MNHDQILQEIKQRKFHPVYFLSGDEPYYIDRITEALTGSILQEAEKEFNQTVLYGLETDVLTVVSEARKYPMMAEYNVVVVKEAQHLRNIEDLSSYIEKPVSSTILVLAYKNKKLDKRKTFYKAVSKNSLFFESKKLYDSQVPEWIIKHLKVAGYDIAVRDAALITEFLGNDLAHISNELGKIILNLPQGSSINVDIIEEFIGINKEYNTFELNDAVGHRNIQKVNRIIQYFGQNEKKYPLQLIIGNLYAHFSKIMKMHYGAGRSKGELAQFIGVHPFFLKDYEVASRHYPRQKLAVIFGILSTYDLKSKGVGNASVGDGELLKEMLYQILH